MKARNLKAWFEEDVRRWEALSPEARSLFAGRYSPHRPPDRSFLLSPAARMLRPTEAARLTDDEAYERFKEIRWSWQGGKPSCHRCGHERIYEFRKTRRDLKCARCHYQFTITTNTVFHGRTLPIKTILHAISLQVHKPPKNGNQLRRAVRVATSTGYTLLDRIRLFAATYRLDRTLLDRVKDVVPRTLPPQVRDDVMQDVIVGVLSGDISEDILKADVSNCVQAHYRNMEWRLDAYSIDQMMPGTDRVWHDVLTAE